MILENNSALCWEQLVFLEQLSLSLSHWSLVLKKTTPIRISYDRISEFQGRSECIKPGSTELSKCPVAIISKHILCENILRHGAWWRLIPASRSILRKFRSNRYFEVIRNCLYIAFLETIMRKDISEKNGYQKTLHGSWTGIAEIQTGTDQKIPYCSSCLWKHAMFYRESFACSTEFSIKYVVFDIFNNTDSRVLNFKSTPVYKIPKLITTTMFFSFWIEDGLQRKVREQSEP